MAWFRRRASAAEVVPAQPPVPPVPPVEPVPRVVPVGELLTADLLATAVRGLSAEAQASIRALARPSLRLVPAGEAGTDPGAVVGRLGGAAMLPALAEWPTWQGRGLQVVAVLDLARLPELPGFGLLHAGWLTFFYDAAGQAPSGLDPAQRDAWRVVHALDAEARTAPSGTATFPEVALAAVEELTAPHRFEDPLAAFCDDEWDALGALASALRPEGEPAHHVGGWPDLIQDILGESAQLASNGIDANYPADRRDPRITELLGGARDWRLLLQVDSDPAAAMTWGDAGRLYYVIREQDLAVGDLDRCWFLRQCQ